MRGGKGAPGTGKSLSKGLATGPGLGRPWQRVIWDEAGAAGVPSPPAQPPETLHKQSCWGDVSQRKLGRCLSPGFPHVAGKRLPREQDGGVRVALPEPPIVYVVFCFFWVLRLQPPDVGCFQTRWLALPGFCGETAQWCRGL